MKEDKGVMKYIPEQLLNEMKEYQKISHFKKDSHTFLFMALILKMARTDKDGKEKIEKYCDHLENMKALYDNCK